MFELAPDVRASIRGLLRRPVYPMVAVSILALGLSASMAVVTYVNAYFQPFPGVDADRLVRVFETADDDAYRNVPYLDFLDYTAPSSALEDTAFEGLAAAQPYYLASVRLEAMTEIANLEAVSGEYFSVLGVRTAIGRGLAADDDRHGAAPVAVISHEWWQRSFGGDAAVLGRTISLNYRPFTVVGVASPEFLGSTSGFRPNVWIPFTPFKDRYTRWRARSEDRDFPLVRVYGRLRLGVRKEQGLATLAATASGLDEAYPRQSGSRRLRLDASTWIDPRSRIEEWATVRVMTAAAGGLLLLVCANVANLLLSVASRRRRETAVRAALGASPGRLVRQVLLENVLLSALAGGVALLLAGPLSHRLGAYFARPSAWGIVVPEGESEPISLVYSKVIPGFFEALGIELRQGRAFGETDTADGRDVAVVNEALARRFFTGGKALGRRLGWPEEDRSFEIVGVVRDTKTEDFFAEPPPTVYLASPQHDYGTTSALMVSVTGDPLPSVPRLHRWLRDFEPYLAIINVVTYQDVVQGFLYTHRMNAELFSIVAFLGLALSVVGIWSVVSLAVSRRTREIAVRMAVGAERVDISRLVLSRSLASVTLGLVLGLTLSYVLAGWVRGLLFGVEPTDPLTLAAGAGVLVLSALSAAYLPARRAATVDPTVSLRQE